MSYVLKKCLNIKLIFIISIFQLINSNPVDIEIKEGSYNNTYTIQSEMQFKVKGIINHNYLKILVSSNQNTENINHIISFYQQDQSFSERKQLSQSLSSSTIMWLTKDQIKADFYFSVQCPKYPCSYDLSLRASNTAEIIIGDQYTYYITEENKIMNFTIKTNEYIQSLDNESDYIVSIWVRGSKDIISSLNIEDSESLHLNYYRVNLSQILNSSECNLVVEGKNGDLINIGILLFKIEESNIEQYLITESVLEYNGIEVVGLLKPFEKTIFKFSEYAYNLEVPYNLDTNELLISQSSEKMINGYYTVELRNYDESPVLYSYKFIKENKNDGNGNNKNYPQLFGFRYSKEINEGETIGVIPMKPDDASNFITYEVINSNLEQEIKASIFHCENYPLCNIDNNTIEQSEKNINYKWFSYYSFNKTEWGNITPISKQQNILLIKCEKGINSNGKKSCDLSENILNDKNKLNMIDYSQNNAPLYKFIRKDEETKYLFKGIDEMVYLNIEIISGDIDIQINSEENESYIQENKNIYIFPENKDVDITIRGKNNSIYLIQDINPLVFTENIINSGANYFFNLENNVTVEPVEFFERKSSKEKNFYLGIYPYECDINVESFKYDGDKKKTLIQRNGFYQVISANSEVKYLFTNKNKNKEKCFVYLSYYELDENNSIYLSNNASQSFIFESDYKAIKFSYVYTKQEIELDVKIKFELINNEGNYKVQLYLNDNKYNESINILSNELDEINIKYEELKKNCKDFRHFCKINLEIESQNEKEYILNIAINKEKEKKEKEKEKNEGDKTLAIILISVGIVLVIIIIIIIILLRTYRKNKDLGDDINKTSFEVNNKKEEGEVLLMEKD